MMEQVRRIIVGLALAGYSCGGHTPPNPVPTPSPSPTPPAMEYSNLLLRTEGVKLTRPNEAKPYVPFGAVQCCMPAPDPVGNSRWPLASESWMDYTKANMFHFRMGPFFGDQAHESEWADIGGPYNPTCVEYGPGCDWNPAFWDKVKALIDHAGAMGANVEINVIDTWYCKHAASNWGDQQMPWPQHDIDSCGIVGTQEQERFIRKTVSETGCKLNVFYITDNEGGEIRGTKRAWYEWVHDIIRDEERRLPCGEVVHLIGTNNTDFGDGSFDYVATHARAELTQPIAGKHTENNERNPQFSAEQEFANYCKAQAAGLHYWFWRAELSDADTAWVLDKMRQGCGGAPIGCFPPAEDDPLWVEPPQPGSVGQNMRPAVEAAKAVIPERCGATAGDPPTIHMGALQTLDMLGAQLRHDGYCAGRSTDSIFIKNPQGYWQEFHAVAFASGCWSNDPAQLPKNTWTYGGNNPAPTPTPTACTKDVPTVDEIGCKLHQATNHIYDCTPKANHKPILAEGDPERAACEEKACGGTPTFTITQPEQSIELVLRDNPYQFQLKGSGTVQLHCTCPATGNSDICYSQTFSQ